MSSYVTVTGTVAQVDSFVKGVEFVNDSAIEVVDIEDGKVTLVDHDGDVDIEIHL